jgi:C4-dicarboxylate-specific signal transduction histidine kinase
VDRATEDLPVDAAAERKYVRESGLRSLLAIPLRAGGHVWGAIAFAAFHQPRRWTDEDAKRLGLVGEIMMEALLRREAGERAGRQQGELAHVARVGALGELTAALAHDLNQPLAAIQANAQAMRRLLGEGRRPDDLDQVCVDIVADATRASELIRRLRELLRRHEAERLSLNVNSIIEDLQSLAQTEASRYGARLVLRLTPDLPNVFGNAAQLQQVLLSLVRNAAQAMVETEPEEREVVVRTSAATAEEVTVSVEDLGLPVGEGSLEDLSTGFHTTKPGGVGTGLAISRSIIEDHGGRLWAERRPKAGLVIHLKLPARKAIAP